MKDGKIIERELGIADAHPNGKRPFQRKQYIEKFKTLTDGIISKKESERFLKDVQKLKKLKAGDLHKLNVEVKPGLQKKKRKIKAIF